MANITIHTCVPLAVAVYAPTHGLTYLFPHAVHLTDLAMTGCAFDAGRQVRLVSEEHVGRFLNPEYAFPGRLPAVLEHGCELLNFGAIGPHCVVAAHARRRIWYRSVARLAGVFMAKATLERRAFVFGEVLPVIEFNWLDGRFGSRAHPQQKQTDRDDNNHKD